jgi:hypothetical protein
MTIESSSISAPAPLSVSDSGLNPVEVIETVIASLDEYQNARVSHQDGGHLWQFKYGSVEVWVQLTGLTEEDTLTVWSPVLKLPVQNQAELMGKLMELNWLNTLESHFAVVQQQVVVVASRSMSDLSVGEISRLITLVATLADDYDDPLQQQYGS